MSRAWLIVPLLMLYLFDLGGVGFLGPDEPRYASIGREMAHSGNLLTPVLDGAPWFEKPPLLYWTTAMGHFLRLPDEWAARLPIALVSIGFLIFYYFALAEEFSPRVAMMAVAILSTSAGWLAYSFVAVPDLLMSATLGAAMCIAMFDTRKQQGYLAGALLGLSILAKAFVPIVLFAPAFLVARGKRLTMLIGAIVVASPWFLLCTLRYGAAFWGEIFWKQQFDRFFTPALQHVQPIWFYVPVMLAGLFPWTPLLGLLAVRKTYDDERIRFLTGWLIFAFAFFSISRNKLPGYVMPLLPMLAVVLAFGLDKAATAAKWWVAVSALMLVGLPTVAAVLPDALLSGVRRASFGFTPAVPFILVAALAWVLSWRDKTVLSTLAVALSVMFGVAYFKGRAFPVLDERVSTRVFWRGHQNEIQNACVGDIRRDWEYGLNYYASRPLPECKDDSAGKRVAMQDGRLVIH